MNSEKKRMQHFTSARTIKFCQTPKCTINHWSRLCFSV